MTGSTLSGRLATGVGQGRHFTRLGWARTQFVDKLGIDPWPGTLNVVVVDPDAAAVWARLKRAAGTRIENPGSGPRDCGARCYRVLVEGCIAGAVVLPEVDGYPPAQVEVIAAVRLRRALGIEDGDPVRLVVAPGEFRR